MKTPLLKPYDPFLHLIVLMLIGFVSVSILLVLGNQLVELFWGLKIAEDLSLLTSYSNPDVISANKLLLVLQHLGLFVLPPLVFAPLVSHSTNQYLNLNLPENKSLFGYAALAMLLALLPINLLVSLNEAITFPEGLSWLEQMFQRAEQQAQKLTEAMLSDVAAGGLIINLFLLAIIPAIGEELMFRGGIQKIIVRWSGNHHAGIWISAVLFSALHFQFYGFFPRLALGALFGYLLVWSGSVWLPVLAHFINNATAVMVQFLIASGKVSESANDLGTDGNGMWLTAISTVLLVAVLWRLQRKSVWPELRESYLTE